MVGLLIGFGLWTLVFGLGALVFSLSALFPNQTLKTQDLRPKTKGQRPKARTNFDEILVRYQIWQRSFSGRTIASPTLHENAAANCGRFDNGPFTRNFGNGCGSRSASIRADSGRIFVAHPRAYPRKNRCSGVNPSMFFFGCPSIAF